MGHIPVSAASIAWNNPAGGSWNQPTNWTPAQVPGAGDSAVIQLAGTYTVDLPSTVTLTSIELGGPGATPTLTLANGILRPTGGTIGSQSSFNITGGTIEGSGTIQGANFISGLISPGGDAHGDLRFPNGLTLNPNVTVRIHVAGITPGTQHDRIRVTGPIHLGDASLDFATANGIGFGQSVLFLENDGVDPISGSFANRVEGSLFDVASRLYRIRYKTGTGNDASLIRDDGAIVLTPVPILTNGLYRVLGLGTNFVQYRIEASTNLTDWIELGTVPANGGGEFQFDDPDTAAFPHRLYRAIGP